MNTIHGTCYTPELSNASLKPTHPVMAVDEYGDTRNAHIAGERPLTLKVDGEEIVTLMTLGICPELLILGYIRNQRLLDNIEEIAEVKVNWGKEVAEVKTWSGKGIDNKRLQGRTVTTGCGQGTVFSCTIDHIYQQRLRDLHIKQSQLYALLESIRDYNQVYRQAGAVHGCALCSKENQILMFVEDVGRHNAADAISGLMWLNNIEGNDKIFYTTGRLTSEIVMKATQMGIPLLLSRSGISHMGLELAQDLGITLIARAKNKHFLIYHGADNVEFDARPGKSPASPKSAAGNAALNA
ncbi:MAG: formate dehydrogenase accessory sulfurtransferase FdhD [Gammaproteobacteria bacterium]